MKELHEQIREHLLKELGEETKLFDNLIHAVEDEYAELWQHLDDIVKLRSLLLDIVRIFMAEHPNLSDLPEEVRKKFHNLVEELISNHDALLQKTRAQEIKEIEYFGSEEWLKKMQHTLSELNHLIANQEKIFYEKWGYGYQVIKSIYDKFSEATRNNDLKVQTLIEIIHHDKKKKLLEVGFGTGPLLSRLWKIGYSAVGYESNQEGLSNNFIKSKLAKGKIIVNEKYYQDYIFSRKFDAIFLESGFLLFTILDSENLIFEAYEGMDYDNIMANLKKFYSDLSGDGMVLIGAQNILKNIKIDNRHFFHMERQQLGHNAIRELFLYENGKLIFYNRQRKRTLTYPEFLKMAWQAGFKRVFISPYRQWIVLQK